jgi:hypothetical protein
VKQELKQELKSLRKRRGPERRVCPNRGQSKRGDEEVRVVD